MIIPSKNIVIFGATGFIGRHIVDYLTREGLGASDLTCLSLPAEEFVCLGAIRNLSNRVPLGSAVIVTAGIKRQVDDSLEAFSKNLFIIQNLCKILSGRKVSNIIYFGSAAVYGEDRQQGVITEETQLRPSSYYGIAKRASEEVLLKWANQSKVENVVILRPTLVYGYGDESNAYGPTGFVYAAIKEKPVILWGDGRELRDFVYIEDIGYIVSFLLKSNISGIFNLSTGNSCSFIDILEYLKEYFPALKVLSRDRTKSKINQRYSIDKLLGVLPSEFAFTPINRGLEKLIINSRIK